MAIQQGSVIWAEVPDPRGNNHKVRPLIVVTKNSEIVGDDLIAAIAVSTLFSLPLEDYEIPLPWSEKGHPLTGLYRACVAVCNWVVPVDPTTIKAIRGPLTSQLLTSIIEKVDFYVPE